MTEYSEEEETQFFHLIVNGRWWTPDYIEELTAQMSWLSNQAQLASRLGLLGYYGKYFYHTPNIKLDVATENQLVDNAIWFARNFPDVPLSSHHCFLLDYCPHLTGTVIPEWIAAARLHPDNIHVLLNAMEFIEESAPSEAYEFAFRAMRLRPHDTFASAHGFMLTRILEAKGQFTFAKKMELFNHISSGSEGVSSDNLPFAVILAFELGLKEQSQQLAKLSMVGNTKHGATWNQQNFHEANVILGCLALEQGERERAIEYLHQSQMTVPEGKTQIEFPSLRLANALLPYMPDVITTHLERWANILPLSASIFTNWIEKIQQGKSVQLLGWDSFGAEILPIADALDNR